jgi:aryl carrier-like protein
MSQPDATVQRDETTAAVQSIVDQIAGAEVDPELSFFDLGLDSIQLMDICNQINERYGEVIDLFLLFENPTIDECADVIRAHRAG